MGHDAGDPDRNHSWIDALTVAAMFLTRLPVASWLGGRWLLHDAGARPTLAESAWAMPVMGAAIGAAGGATFAVAMWIGLPSLVAAFLALAVTIALTGALHEDGLADVADGLGAMLAGRADRAAALHIMRDSRIGTFGVLALVITAGLRAAALGDLPAASGAAALIAAHAGARGLLPLAMQRMIPARADGLAILAGRPTAERALVAAGIGALACLILLGPLLGALALLGAAASAWALATLARRCIGGYTGDVLGAIEQLGETAILLVVAAML
ncbi:MAG: adenosylcobinamide-GDP ribazoletransferase [Alphaproteobacteria bacterium]|nr:adenosylcobinamide-GDP ribazoletransferase [Alphaproteobacteria bacterium]